MAQDLKHTTLAELKELKLNKLITNDMEVRIVFTTQDISILQLGNYPADTLFELNIRPSKEYGL